MMAVFPSATDALGGAATMVLDVRELDLALRVGVSAGEVGLEDKLGHAGGGGRPHLREGGARPSPRERRREAARQLPHGGHQLASVGAVELKGFARPLTASELLVEAPARINLLGDVEADPARIALVYLAANRHRPVTAEELADAVGPDVVLDDVRTLLPARVVLDTDAARAAGGGGGGTRSRGHRTGRSAGGTCCGDPRRPSPRNRGALARRSAGQARPRPGAVPPPLDGGPRARGGGSPAAPANPGTSAEVPAHACETYSHAVRRAGCRDPPGCRQHWRRHGRGSGPGRARRRRRRRHRQDRGCAASSPPPRSPPVRWSPTAGRTKTWGCPLPNPSSRCSRASSR